MNRRDFAIAASASAAPLAATAVAQTTSPLTQSALVIGNNAYVGGARLVNAVRDAKLMHSTFERLGAASSLHMDLSGADMARIFEAHVVSLRRRPVDIAWVFLSGHGVQVDGRSLLLGVDANSDRFEDVQARSYSLDKIKALLESARPQVCVVVVDACRDNPFPSQTRSISAAKPGLVTESWGGSLVAFSTAPFTVAQDWPNRPNGPYAGALNAALLAPKSRQLEQVFKDASDVVYAATGREQLPGYYSELRAQVWLDNGVVALRRPPAVSAGTGAPPERSGAARSVSAGFYRADAIPAGIYAEATARDWQRITSELEGMAFRFDSGDAKEAVREGRTGQTGDRERTLAGLLLEQGKAGKRDLPGAAQLYERAAKNGFVTAQVLLGELEFARKNYAVAYRWISLAAQTGWTRPLLNQAQLLAGGQGVNASPEDAARRMMDALRGLAPPNSQNR